MARRPADSLIFDSLHLEGGLFVPALLEKAARGDHTAQKATDYRLPKGLGLVDEQGRAFRIASAVWKNFQATRARRDVDAHRATIAHVAELLRDALGYSDLTPATEPFELDGRFYPVTALVCGGRVPVIIAPHGLDLDDPDERFAIGGTGTRRRSAHQLAQQFLNASAPCAWALVTNGRTLRLVRDADTLTRPAFLDADLDLILRDQRYADFAALWRLFHATRAGDPGTPGDSCVWETWHREGQEQGERVRDGLRHGVTQALLALGSGFLAHPHNEALRRDLDTGTLTKDAYFQQLLRLIYRCLFLFTVEERGLLHVEDESPEARSARDTYAQGYAVRRLRDRALRRSGFDRHHDLWAGLLVTFRGLAHGQPLLALPALGGLFAPTQCPHLDAARLENRALLEAMRHLRWSGATGQLAAIDYRNMGPEELGSVYESLLELVPTIELPTRRFGFVGLADGETTAGNARKTSGSYYTPDSLVQELLKSALDPVIAQKLAASPENPAEALLCLSVVDPACGSGHFLLAAARRLAEKLAELRAPDGAVTPAGYRHALREVISRCIHGVDRNPMAVELARTALWLEGYEPGQPLSFLDHHLACGDALLGLTHFNQLAQGLPDDAFTALSGDSKELCSKLKKANKSARKQLDDLRKGQDLYRTADQADILAEYAALEALPETTPAETAAKETAWRAFLTHAKESPIAQAADVFVGTFLTPKPATSTPPDTTTLIAALYPAKAILEQTTRIAAARTSCAYAKVLHWPLAFPKIFARGGFDCILGNPPWEVSQMGEEEYFAARAPQIANLAGAKRKVAIAELETTTPKLWAEYLQDKRLNEATNTFYRESGRFNLTAVGKLNTYPLFSETITQLTHQLGRAGFIVPTGIATDDSTKAFFSYIAEGGKLVSLFDFENREGVFPGVHRSFKFCLITLGTAEKAEFACYLAQTSHLQDSRRRFTLSTKDFRLLNPNTRTCPIFRSQADAELTKKIYRRVPVLIEEALDKEPEKNPWDITFSQGLFNMTSDSALFLDQHQPDSLPLYESKMMHQFDHRWSTYRWDANEGPKGGYVTEDVSDTQKADPNFAIHPRYWVPSSAVEDALISNKHDLYPLFWAARNKRRDELAYWFRFWLWGHELLGAPGTSPACLAPGTQGSAPAASLVGRSGPDRRDSPSTPPAPASENIPSLSPAEHQTRRDLLRSEMESTKTIGFSAMELMMAAMLDPGQAEKMARAFPLTAAEQAQLWHQIRQDGGLISTKPGRIGAKESEELSPAWETLAQTILPLRQPRWLMGWRDITNATNERTVIASVIPRAAVGHTMPLFFTKQSPRLTAALLVNMNSLALDFVARQKIGGTHLTYGYLKQLPILSPDAYTETDLAFIVPRVLELTYTSHDLAPWAADLGHTGAPFPYDPPRRAQLRAELDAYYARLYGLTRDELRYILDPADTHGPDYPTETFRGLKANDIKNHGLYRTQRLVLAAWDKQELATFVIHFEAAQGASASLSFRDDPLPQQPTQPRKRLSTDESHWLVFVYHFLMQTKHEATLPLLEKTWTILIERGKYSVDGALILGDEKFKSWNDSFFAELPNLGFIQFIAKLHQSGWIEVTRGSWIISIPDNSELLKNPPDEWRNYDVAVALKITSRQTDYNFNRDEEYSFVGIFESLTA